MQLETELNAMGGWLEHTRLGVQVTFSIHFHQNQIRWAKLNIFRYWNRLPRESSHSTKLTGIPEAFTLSKI